MNHLEVINKYLEGVPERIKTIDLYKKIFCQLNPQVDEMTFRQSLTQWFREGKIVGFESVRGRNGGIVRIGVRPSKPVEEKPANEPGPFDALFESEEEEEDDAVIINIPGGFRIAKLDKRNWGFQKKSGDNWINNGYYPTFAEALKGASKKLLDSKVETHLSTGADMREFSILLQVIQKDIETMLAGITVSKVEPEELAS